MFEGVHEPGKSTSLALAVAVHVAFVVFLYVGISWQRKPLPPLEAQLWSELPPAKPLPRKVEPARPVPPPVVEKKPEPQPKPPEPPEPAQPPKPEPKPPTRAEIEL